MSNRHKTPLRYPGGKQKLAPFVIEILEENNLIGGDYVEPYAGGAGVAIELLLEGKVDRIHLNDSSRAVYSFWRAVLGQTDEFCRKIESTELTINQWRRQRDILANPTNSCVFELGFSLFYMNRCNRSGIPTGGVIGGLKQDGEWLMNARFPKEEMVARVRAIGAQKRRIRLKNWDAEDFIQSYVPGLPADTLVYCDPPYFKQGHRLYLSRYQSTDHARIAKVIQTKLQRPWIVSYDGVPEILEFYDERRSFLYDLQYNAQRVHMGREVFIFSDTIQLPASSKVKTINAVMRTAAA